MGGFATFALLICRGLLSKPTDGINAGFACTSGKVGRGSELGIRIYRSAVLVNGWLGNGLIAAKVIGVYQALLL